MTVWCLSMTYTILEDGATAFKHNGTTLEHGATFFKHDSMILVNDVTILGYNGSALDLTLRV